MTLTAVLTVKVIHLKPIGIRSSIIDRLEFFFPIRSFDRGGFVFNDPFDYVLQSVSALIKPGIVISGLTNLGILLGQPSEKGGNTL